MIQCLYILQKCVKVLVIPLCATLHSSMDTVAYASWTVVCQAPLSMGVSRQEYWSEWTFSSPGDLPDPGIKPTSLAPSALAGGFFTISTIWEAIQLAKHAMKENRYRARRKRPRAQARLLRELRGRPFMNTVLQHN